MPVNVAILVAEDPPQSGVTTLLEAHHRLGHTVRVVHLSQVGVTSGRLTGFPGGLPDVAHSRASALWGLAVQEAIEPVIPIVNTTAGQRAGRDKWVCARRLAASSVASLPTLLAVPGLTVDQVCEAIGDDVVVKPLAGFGGFEVARCRGRQEIAAAIRPSGERLHVLQPYRHVGGRDLRVVVIDDHPVVTIERQARPGGFRANAMLGAHLRAIKPTPEIESLSILAAQACGLDMAGVDMIETSDGPLVIEVNTNTGGLDQMRSLTGVDVAAAMAACVAARLTNP